MHTKFSLSKEDFEKMVENQQFEELAARLKELLEKKEIREGDYESAMAWLRGSAKMNGKSI